MRRRFLLLLALTSLMSSGSGFGQDAYTDGQNAVRDVFPQGGQELLDASEVQALPSYSDTPTERSYFSNPSAMNGAGQSALAGNGAASAAYSRAISTNYLDPAATRSLLAAGLAVEADPLAVVGADVGLSGQYGACTDTAVYDTTTGRYGCEVSGTSRTEDRTCDYTGRPSVQTVWIYTTGDSGQRSFLVGQLGCQETSHTIIPGPIPRNAWEITCTSPVATSIPVRTVTQQNGYSLDPTQCAAFQARGECTGFSEVCVRGPEVAAYGVANGGADYASYIDYHSDLLAAFTTGAFTPCAGLTKADKCSGRGTVLGKGATSPAAVNAGGGASPPLVKS